MQSIFLLGSERSGSNLLRTLLGNHSQIAAPIAPHLCPTFLRHFKQYHPIEKKSNKRELLADINSFVNHSFHDWKINFNLNELDKYKLNSFIDFVHYAYSEYAKLKRKEYYFSKDNNNHDFALGILKDIPDAKFIYLYRDPRDQVASWMRTPIHLHTPYDAVKKWKDEQRAILELRDFYKIEMHQLKYEKLVDNPEYEMTAILNFLSLPVEKACFQTRKENKEADKHPLWKNINKPVRKKNYGKYRDILSETDINMIETLCQQQMQYLDYEATTLKNWSYGNRRIFNFKERLKKKKSIKMNRNFIEKEMSILQDKSEFIKEIFSRHSK